MGFLHNAKAHEQAECYLGTQPNAKIAEEENRESSADDVRDDGEN